MRTRLATSPSLPEPTDRNLTKLVSEPVSLVARFASIQQKRNENARETERRAAMDKLAAEWLDEALSEHPNLKQLEEDYGCEKAFISQARNGHVAMPLRFILPLIEHPDVIDKFTNAIRADAGLPLAPRRAARVSREQLLEMALAIFIESPGLLRTLINEAGARYGANAEDVAVALTATK